MKVTITCDPLLFTYLDLIKKKELDKKYGIDLDIYQVISPNLHKEVLKVNTFHCHYARTYYAIKAVFEENKDLKIIDAVEIISPGFMLRKDLILDKSETYEISGCEEGLPLVHKYLSMEGYNVRQKYLPVAAFKEFLEKKIIHGIALPKSFVLSASLQEIGHRFVIKPEEIENKLGISITSLILCRKDIADNLKEIFTKIKRDIIELWKNKKEIVNYFLIDRDFTKEVSNYLYENARFYSKEIDEEFIKVFKNYLKLLYEYKMLGFNPEEVDVKSVFHL